MENLKSGYVVVWQFTVKSGMEEDFEFHYGSRGPWCGLFQHADGYHGSELLRDSKTPGRYITIDYWSSKELYDDFCMRSEREYQRLDQQCAALTETEELIGTYVAVSKHTM